MDCFSELESFLISLGPFEGFLFFIFEICASLFCKEKDLNYGPNPKQEKQVFESYSFSFQNLALSLKTPFKKYDKKKKKRNT